MPPRARATVSRIDCFAPVQLLLKTMNIEAIFIFNFGVGKDRNLLVHITEFVDSEVYSSRDCGDYDSDYSSDSDA